MEIAEFVAESQIKNAGTFEFDAGIRRSVAVDGYLGLTDVGGDGDAFGAGMELVESGNFFGK